MAKIASRSSSSDIITSILVIPTLSLIDIRSGGQLGSFLQAARPRCVSCILCAALGWAGLGWLGWVMNQ